MKLFKGKKRLALKRINTRHREILTWALSVKPGDYVASCEGTNRKVAKVKPIWRNEGEFMRGNPNRTYFLDEVIIEDTHGRWHTIPGCATYPETPEEVTAYQREWAIEWGTESVNSWFKDNPERLEKALGEIAKFQKAFYENRAIVDEHGELLPEFDRY